MNLKKCEFENLNWGYCGFENYGIYSDLKYGNGSLIRYDLNSSSHIVIITIQELNQTYTSTTQLTL